MAQRIMVFNDTTEILELFYEILSGEGYEVRTYTYGTLDLPIVQSYAPDLIILDFPPSYREEQGWQLLQKIKMSRATQDIALLICTTNMRAVRDNEGWLATKDIVTLPKPFVVDDLLQAVEFQLQRTARAAPNDPPAPREHER